HRRAARGRASSRPGGRALEVQRRKAPEGTPHGGLVASPPDPVDARVCRRRHPVPARVAPRARTAPHDVEPPNLGDGRVQTARVLALERTGWRRGDVSEAQGRERTVATEPGGATTAASLARYCR